MKTVSQNSKMLRSPSPNGLEDLLTEVLVFKSRRGGTEKHKLDVYVSCTLEIILNWKTTRINDTALRGHLCIACRNMSQEPYLGAKFLIRNVFLVSGKSPRYSFPRHMLGQWISRRWPLK